MELTWLNTALGFVINLLVSFRELITKLVTTLNLPEQTYTTIFFLGLSLFLGYMWMKQWVAYSVFTKFSTILNWILVALLFYVIFMRVG